jgi:phosphatidylglycerophosphate synthase
MPREAIVLRADCVLDESLVRALISERDALLTASGSDLALAAHVDGARAAAVAAALGGGAATDSPVFAHLRRASPAELAGAYNHALRKRAAPLALSLSTTPAREIEWQTYRAAYKGVTDVVTKWVWPRPAFWVTRWAAARSITPNAVTAVSFALVLAAYALFNSTHFAAGLVAAWGMTFLDTVDGKLARVTLTSSKIGNVFDHGIDLVHPPFWYWAWWRGAAVVAPTAWLEPAMWIVVVGYVVGRLLEGVFLALFKFEIHAWRPIDSLFRQVTARRNPNLILLTLAILAGRPDAGLVAVGVWTILSTVFHVVRIVQGVVARAAGAPPTSWLDAPEPLSSPIARVAA